MENMVNTGLFNNAYQGTKVLLTGHTGFKGSWLAYWLHELSATVTGLSLNIPTHPNHFKLLQPAISSSTGDIRNFENVQELSKNYTVIGLVRDSSDLWRYEEVKNENIHLINTANKDYKLQLESFAPQSLIHCAWSGVAAEGRDNWPAQLANITLTFDLLQLAKNLGIKQFIGLGSQAEYGSFNGSIDETYPCKPYSAYGAIKLATLDILESYCNQHNITWYWLRLFPMYGTREGFTWFIPSVIKNALENTGMNLTGCEQRYGYLNVKKFAGAIEKMLLPESFSGVYNVAAKGSIRLREVIELIIRKTNTTGSFNFGALPYRNNQVMHMEGNSEKFTKIFNVSLESELETGIDELIKYYRNKLGVTALV